MEKSIELARFNMIHQQIRPWGVLDERVLEVMGAVARESFVPDGYRGLAYADTEIPIGGETSMLAPKLVARMLQALDVRPGDRVLEIGTGTGYAAACLSGLGARVTSVEIDSAQAADARERLSVLKVRNVEVEEADGLAGPVSGGPFDAIAVTGSMPTDAALPMLQGQLTIGGRLCCILGEAPVMDCVLITREGKADYRRVSLFETSVPALANAPEAETFVL